MGEGVPTLIYQGKIQQSEVRLTVETQPVTLQGPFMSIDLMYSVGKKDPVHLLSLKRASLSMQETLQKCVRIRKLVIEL